MQKKKEILTDVYNCQTENTPKLLPRNFERLILNFKDKKNEQ